MFTRRSFIQTGLCAGASTTLLMGQPKNSYAASTDGYKAIIAIWLLGGMDGHDVVIPLSIDTHSMIKNAREGIFTVHEAAGKSREIANLLPLSDNNSAAHNGQRFGLVKELTDLHSLYERGEMAILGSVGTLLRPMNRKLFDESINFRPRRLFSHNDQRLAWSTFAGEGSTRGWGGAFTDAFKGSSSLDYPDFLGIRFAGDKAFLTGQSTQPLSLNTSKPVPPASKDFMRLAMRRANQANIDEISEIFEAHASSLMEVSPNYYVQDIIAENTRSVKFSRFYSNLIKDATTFTTPFPDTSLGKQLEAIAAAISVRDKLNIPRQIFSSAIGGWDTHKNQANSLPSLLEQINDAVIAFRAAMIEINAWKNVTLFTASDFGRSLVENGSGTDHGWGGHHFVIGGEVQGTQIAGRMPLNWDFKDLTENGEFVSGRGSLIPSTSVEQYAASLGQWLGLTPAELNTALPNLGSFPAGSPRLFSTVAS